MSATTDTILGAFKDIGLGLSYAAGQCTAFVADVDQWVKGNWGAAGNWYSAASRAGYPTSQTPVPGAIAVWEPNANGGNNAGPDGHVAVVASIGANGFPIVDEANFDVHTTAGRGTADRRQLNAASTVGLLGYILPPGGSPSDISKAGHLVGPPSGSTLSQQLGLQFSSWLHDRFGKLEKWVAGDPAQPGSANVLGLLAAGVVLYLFFAPDFTSVAGRV